MKSNSYSTLTLFALLWFLLSIIVSSINDNMTKLMTQSLSPFQIIFFRFFFSTVTLLPFILKKDYKLPSFNNIKVHFFRGAFIYCAMLCWCISFQYVSMATMTTISFTIPLFVLSFAKFFLKEEIGWLRFIATLTGFIGILIICRPYTTSHYLVLFPLLVGAMTFAASDIVNKKMLKRETTFNMIFFCAFFSTLISMPLAVLYWSPLNIQSLLLLICLGCGSNLILFFILKAFKLANLSLFSSIRYLEILFTGILAYFMFGESITHANILGMLIIITTTFFISIYEIQKSSPTPSTSLKKSFN